jgi:hypothetical protein
MFLSGCLDDESSCKVGMVTLRSCKVLSGLASQGLYEITLREEFVRYARSECLYAALFATFFDVFMPP